MNYFNGVYVRFLEFKQVNFLMEKQKFKILNKFLVNYHCFKK